MRRLSAVFLLALGSGLGIARDKPAFEVASVRLNESVGQAGILKPTSDGLLIENMSVLSCARWAWNLKPYEVLTPAWLKPADAALRFDVVAKAADAASHDQLRLMLRSLLEERFGLAAHLEQKNMPVFALVLAKGGPKQLHESKRGNPAGTELASTDATGAKHWVFHNSPISSLGGLFSAPLDRPILDMTELQGTYDFAFIEPPADGPAADHVIGDIFPEMQRQLGIKVEARSAPLEVLIVDWFHRMPTEN